MAHPSRRPDGRLNRWHAIVFVLLASAAFLATLAWLHEGDLSRMLASISSAGRYVLTRAGLIG